MISQTGGSRIVKAWVTERLNELTRAFAINICAYAVMCNHYHLVLHVDTGRAQAWSDQVCAALGEALSCLAG